MIKLNDADLWIGVIGIAGLISAVIFWLVHIKDLAIIIVSIACCFSLVYIVSRFSRKWAYFTIGLIALFLMGCVLYPVAQRVGVVILVIRILAILASPFCLRRFVVHNDSNNKPRSYMALACFFALLFVAYTLGENPDADYYDPYPF